MHWSIVLIFLIAFSQWRQAHGEPTSRHCGRRPTRGTDWILQFPNKNQPDALFQSHDVVSSSRAPFSSQSIVTRLPRGGGGSWFLAGWNPFGYKLTELGAEFLSFECSSESDVGRFLSSLKQRKRVRQLKENWLEVVRVAKTRQALRIYRKLDALIQFCLRAGFIE